MIGQIVGNYKIEEKLGEGGMGAVYKGVDTMLDREVAIKALRPELASQTAVVERFRTEAVTLAKLNHPNIATLYTMFRQGEELYMVLEFVRGETLDNILQRRGVLPADEAIPVFCQVLDGIDHAHELGIVHRDIKPANMMLTEKGTLKVLDFGIARLLGSARMTRAGNIIGTLEYMAPEQVRGQETDGRSDIYALGMMLYEALTGRLPFDTQNEFELMKAQTEIVPPNPRSINPSIPPDVDAAIMKAIEKDPDKRFQTGGEFREVLLEAGFSASGTMHGATGSYKRPSTRPSRPAMPVDRPASGQVSNAGIKETRLGAQPAAAPKETRLGAGAAASTSAGAMKATRLGNAPAPETHVAAASAGNPSFFSKLSAIHYVGAGLVLLIVASVGIGVPLLLFLGSSSAAKTEAVQPAKAESGSQAQKPEVITLPQQPAEPAPQPMSEAALPPANNLVGAPAGQLPVADPVPVAGKAPATSQKPAAAKTPAPPKPRSAPKTTRAEKLLTDDGD
jgi:tRNA A-37 threonylcarbamoyl transferase component Bud32